MNGSFIVIGGYVLYHHPGNTKGGSIAVPLTSCLTGLDPFVLQIKTKIVSCHTADSQPVKQEVNSTPAPSNVILSGRHFLMKLCVFIVRNGDHRKPFELVGGI